MFALTWASHLGSSLITLDASAKDIRRHEGLTHFHVRNDRFD